MEFVHGLFIPFQLFRLGIIELMKTRAINIAEYYSLNALDMNFLEWRQIMSSV